MFLGYCFFKDGSYTEPVHLDTISDAFHYVLMQMKIQHEVRVVDEDDYIVLHAVDNKLLFPKSDCTHCSTS